MQSIGRNGLRAGFLSLLTEGDVERIHEGALQVLSKTGIIVHDEIVLSLLGKAGCRVMPDECRVHIPATVVEQAVAQAPREVHLYNRLGEQAMVLGPGAFHARTSSGATTCVDPEDGRRREPTVQDAADAARLADALPHVHGVSTMAVQPADLRVESVDVRTVRLAVANTVKPLGYVCLNARLIEPVLDMMSVVVGGEKALREKPAITALAESTSPLQLVSSQMAVLLAFAGRGLPLTLHAHPMAGMTAPVTLAGELVITHAEVLALVTIAQLTRAGTPVVYGMSSSVPDMRSGTNLSGAVEIGLLGAAVAKLARRCGLPCLMSSGSDAHVPGAQSVMERLMTLLVPALAGIDLVNLTTLDTKMAFSPAQLVVDETLLTVVERCLQGIRVDEGTLALDLIDDVGPGGAFIGANHTLDRFREELLIPDLVDRRNRDAWESGGAPDMRTFAREKAMRILAEHKPAPLAGDVIDQLDAIVVEAEGRGSSN